MAFTAQELSKLLTESKKARNSLDKVLDFVDLINKRQDDFPGDVNTPGQGIRGNAEETGKYIEEISSQINELLNEFSVDADEVKDAAKKLLLYHGDIIQLIHYVETQKTAYKESSYWWRYWQAVTDILNERMVK
ncbi:MAG: hypothetical protein L0Y68_03460 [Candidatus Dadabacteria bacterium]|nr:hypothetical protein [Candidatus Dadabacteria bacterium]